MIEGSEPNIAPRRRVDGVERRRAVVIGVDEYPDPALRLAFCAADAVRVGELLRARGFEVTLLVTPARGRGGEAPTRAAVVRAIDDVAGASDEDDLVVVYASCHGKRLDGRPHLLLADTPGDDAGIGVRGLALSEVLDRLRGRARWVALFLDVCQMGLGLDPTIGRAARRGGDGGFALLAGSTSRQISQDSTTGGIFSKVLVEGLEGAAADPDGGVRFSALARHVQDGVARWRRSAEGKLKASSQRPVLRLEVADLQLLPGRHHVALEPDVRAAITCAAFSRDGLRVVTGAADGSLRVWDTRSAAQVFATRSHGAPIQALAAGSSGHIATASIDGVVKSWSSGDGTETPPPNRFPAAVYAVGWSATGTARICATAAGVWVQPVFDIVLSRIERPVLDADTRALVVLDSGFVAGGADGVLRWWDGASKRTVVVGTLRGPVRALAATPDGFKVVAVADEQPRLFDLDADTEVPLGGHPGPVASLACTADGASVATAGSDGVVRIFDARGVHRRALAIEAEGRAPPPAATVVAFSPAGDVLFVGHADGRARLWRL